MPKFKNLKLQRKLYRSSCRYSHDNLVLINDKNMNRNNSFKDFKVIDSDIISRQSDGCDMQMSSSLCNSSLNTNDEVIGSSSQLTEFMKTVLYELTVIKGEIVQLKEKMDNITSLMSADMDSSTYSETTPPDSIFWELKNLPLKTMKEVNDFELMMNSTEHGVVCLTDALFAVGGCSLDNVVRRMLRKLFTDDVASEITLYGTKAKMSLINLTIYKALTGAIQRTTFFQNRTEDEVEGIIKNWFRHAKARKSKNIQAPSPSVPTIEWRISVRHYFSKLDCRRASGRLDAAPIKLPEQYVCLKSIILRLKGVLKNVNALRNHDNDRGRSNIP
ncbi:hypothetical protein NPIL_658331 [Nephila pilipes]|uniref:DUF4806 domain-containing protein n=1 Tax=Nephila pilipes TaxID=299642 RepID=A0A8X6P071_NEPPI|nr:hypothetical protein NPIL_658331 [Nephila pilipes]